jgi:hypothetical protein
MAMAADLPEEHVQEAVHIARNITDDDYRSDALAALAPRCPQLLFEIRWKDHSKLFDVVRDLTLPLEGRVALFRRELSSAKKPAAVLDLVRRSHTHEQPWPISDAIAARLADAIEAIGERWP